MSAPNRFPLALADRCVKCGLCLPHCPTYRLAGVEGESPRGRIALMQGLAQGALEVGPGLIRHLEQCLGCRACERVCPAAVPYGELIDAGRELLVEQGAGPSASSRWMARLLRRPGWLRFAIAIAQLPGARAMARLLGGPLGRAAQLLPADARPPRWPDHPRTEPAPRGEVLLFTGCVGAAVDGRGLEDVARLLGVAGWQLRIPAQQACCGAMDLHAGRPREARALALRNLEAFGGESPIVACASGCAATLLEYRRLAAERGAAFAARVRDPAELLAVLELPRRPAPGRRVVLHLPCTQRNVTGSADATRQLLARLPGVELRELPAGCCGAAGEMFVSRPALSDALLEPWLEDLARDPPDALVTSNIGCALHFRAGLARRGLDIQVLQPASLVLGALE